MKLDAYLWAVQAGGTTVFSDLKTGDTFQFPPSRRFPSVTFVKGSGGWFRPTAGGRSYRTGANAAVVLIARAA